MEENILTTIKKMTGIEEGLDAFDSDIMVFINSAFSTLNQLGAGPPQGFAIVDGSECWDDYSKDLVLIGFVKTYIATRVKKTFDPPASTALLKAMDETVDELTWRIIVQLETTAVKPEPPAIEN